MRQALERKAGFNPDQPRDDHGRWTGTGGGTGSGQSVIRDTTGNEPWEHVVRDRRADGSLAQELVFNRDGSTIHSEFAGAGDGLAWDERHTVVTTSGERIRFETAGEVQTIADANSGDVLGSSRWTDAGPEPEATLQPVFDPRGYAVTKTIEAAAVLWVWLSTRNDADGSAVLAFKADDYRAGEAPAVVPSWVGRLTRHETDAACPRHPAVQSRTDAAADAVRREGNYWTAADYGTKVHKNLERQIKFLDDPNFVAEQSMSKNDFENYGTPGSIRVDVLERVGNGTVCVYDIKTGRRGLSAARSAEIVGTVFQRYSGTRRIVLIETRPRR
ncbi:MAG: hypothetical protein R3D68_07625 [Hyphomicrobiaceae bacterium]